MYAINEVRCKTRPHGKRVAFTGHRPQKLPFGFDEGDPQCILFKARLFETVEGLCEEGYRHFLSGGALGYDTFAAEAVLRVKHLYPDVILEMVSPYDAQTELWTFENRMRHDWLFAQADIVTATGHDYTPTCMARRNRYLVSNADLVLAAYSGQDGGTAATVRYADALHIPVRIFWPFLEKKAV
ncbi:MAG: DUF1273 family protein [Clostridia bacterium]|nr:DUF1273 family protein [Clostridia bacterium]